MLSFKLNLQREPLFYFVEGQLYLAALGTLGSRRTWAGGLSSHP